MHAKLQLTKREQEVARRLLKFEPRKAIAEGIGIALSTVDFHVRNLRRKCAACCREELAVKLSRLNGALSRPNLRKGVKSDDSKKT